MAESKRQEDLNGYWEIPDNPISKIGVFPYLGSQVGLTGQDAGKIVYVFRSAEELGDPDTVSSFRLQPWIDEHLMLGSEDIGLTPAEKKGVGGVIGEKVYFDGEYLRGNLKIFSEAQKSLIDAGKKELSAGYRCKYIQESGTFRGEPYQFIQTNIRANHLALVGEGRCGPDVAVLDSMAYDEMTFTIDAKELATMADENTEASGETTLAKIKALVEQLKPLLAEQAEASSMLAELGLVMPEAEIKEEVVDETSAPKPDAEVETDADPAKETQAMDKIVKAMDSMTKTLASLTTDVAALKQGATGMDSAILNTIAERDALVQKVSPFIGVFDAKTMTAPQVAKYAVDKLGLKCAEGQERIALDGYLHGRVPDHKLRIVSTAEDGKQAADAASAWGAQGEKA